MLRPVPPRTTFADRLRRRRRGRRTREAAWVLLVAVLAGLLVTARFDGPERLAPGDTYWYLLRAQTIAGTDHATAAATASRLMCRDINRAGRAQGTRPTCRNYDTSGISPRYAAIFDSRPGYPTVAAPFVAALGPWRGMVAATLALGVLATLLAYAAVRMASGVPLVGAVAAVSLLLLPSGLWITRLLAEGMVAAGCLGVIIGVTAVWRHGHRWGWPVIAGALVWTFAAKPSNGAALAGALVATGLVVAVRAAAPARRRAAGLAGLGAAFLTAWFALAAVLGLPGLTETVQDYATRHFRRPDIDDPLGFLLDRNRALWGGRLEELAVSPGPLVLAVAAVAVLVFTLRAVGLVWAAVGATGLVVVAVHPLASQYDRLVGPVWLPVAAAVGLAVGSVLHRPPVAAGPTSGPSEPAAGG